MPIRFTFLLCVYLLTAPLARRDKDREVIVQRCPGFFPDLPGSPLQLTVTPHNADHYKLSNLSSPNGQLPSWSSPGPHTPGSSNRPRYSAAVAPTHHGRQTRPVRASHDEHLAIKPVHPPLRNLPAPTPLHLTSPLCQARDLKHKQQLEHEHKLGAQSEDNAGRVDDEDTEESEKSILYKLKSFIGDEVTTASWDMDAPLKSWRRVRTNKSGIYVEGLSLVSTSINPHSNTTSPLYTHAHYNKMLS
jgi:hypothetical protein